MGTRCTPDCDDCCTRDHPHACGDKFDRNDLLAVVSGSSPRVWGQADLRHYRVHHRGIIPTRVGTSSVFDVLQLLIEDHPHACGDKCSLPPNNRLCSGSSPRVWGQVIINAQRISPPRIIPTRVGTSRSPQCFIFVKRDHPHACGDKLTDRLATLLPQGSSPRVWGHARCLPRRVGRTRIIPTRVGTRVETVLGGSFSWDHPHACGDKQGLKPYHGEPEGSSPRVWGQETRKRHIHLSIGIIPTRVGTSLSHHSRRCKARDHPHACGDKFAITKRITILAGSSPRVWGQD